MDPPSDEARRERLKPFEALLAQGLITPEEFEAERRKLLDEAQVFRCDSCGAGNPSGAEACFNCGTELRVARVTRERIECGCEVHQRGGTPSGSHSNELWVCLCGNASHEDGFYHCDETGRKVEPEDVDWDDAWMICLRCGRIINFWTLEVRGHDHSAPLP